MLNGLLNLSVTGLVIATLILTHITIISVTIYLHRHQSHRALDLHPAVSHFFRFWLWLTTAQRTKEWVAIHRKHHAFVDKKGDPHSPVVYGLRKIVLEGVELYQKEAKNEETLNKYSHGTPDDWIERHLYSRFKPLGIGLMLILDLIFFGVIGITVWAIQMLWMPVLGAGFINGVGHYWGYRNFEIKDASTNIMPWGILIGGEELHNNHHTYASSAKLSVKWWEFDIGWFYIKLLSLLKLAKVKKISPKLTLSKDKLSVDLDSVSAVIRNRFQVMACYYKDVILPVLKYEKNHHHDKATYGHAKRLLKHEDTRLDLKSKTRLSNLLNVNCNLRTVYEYRIELQKVWLLKRSSQAELLTSLQQWCEKAEQSGIETLQKFSAKIKSFTWKSNEC
ncbi:MAG: fatty acid desaturase [Legionella sp.]|nr:fatty acid desaturase [Legionella sp.]